MKPTLKACLMSALLYPGAGHILLSRTIAGYIFITLTTVAILLLFAELFSVTLSLTNAIPPEQLLAELPEHVATIRSQVLFGNDSSSANLSLITIFSTWTVALADCLRIHFSNRKGSASQD